MKRLALVGLAGVAVVIAWPLLRCPWCHRRVWGWNYAKHVATEGRERVDAILYG